MNVAVQQFGDNAASIGETFIDAIVGRFMDKGLGGEKNHSGGKGNNNTGLFNKLAKPPAQNPIMNGYFLKNLEGVAQGNQEGIRKNEEALRRVAGAKKEAPKQQSRMSSNFASNAVDITGEKIGGKYGAMFKFAAGAITGVALSGAVATASPIVAAGVGIGGASAGVLSMLNHSAQYKYNEPSFGEGKRGFQKNARSIISKPSEESIRKQFEIHKGSSPTSSKPYQFSLTQDVENMSDMFDFTGKGSENNPQVNLDELEQNLLESRASLEENRDSIRSYTNSPVFAGFQNASKETLDDLAKQYDNSPNPNGSFGFIHKPPGLGL